MTMYGKTARPAPKRTGWPHDERTARAVHTAWTPRPAAPAAAPDPDEERLLATARASQRLGDIVGAAVPLLLIVGFFVGFVALFVWLHHARLADQAECRSHGGRVVDIRGSRDAAWACLEAL